MLVHMCRRKSDQSDPDWLVQLELSRRVSAAHRAAEQCLMKANNALRTLEEVLKALTHMAYVLPSTNQVCELILISPPMERKQMCFASAA